MLILNKMKKKKGFTLIELLVVISIVSVLSSVVLTQTKAARDKANDAKRVSDLQAIRTALELYRNDYGTYPTGGSTCSGNVPVDWPTSFKNALAPYLSPIPRDPEHSKASCTTGSHYYYYNFSNPIWDGGWTGTLCLSTVVPRPIILFSTGRPGGKRFANECGFTYTNQINNYYLNRQN